MANLIAIMCRYPSTHGLWSMGQGVTHRELTGKVPWALDSDKDGVQVQPFCCQKAATVYT